MDLPTRRRSGEGVQRTESLALATRSEQRRRLRRRPLQRVERELAANPFDVSLRTIWNREHLPFSSAEREIRGRGRSPHSVFAWRIALRRVRRVLKRCGFEIGEPSVCAMVGNKWPRCLVREALAQWKRHERTKEARRRAALRRSITPNFGGMMWPLDGAWIGRYLGRTVRV